MSKKQLMDLVDKNYEKVNGLYVQRVVCYIRVSTQEQKLHGLSIEAQKMKLQEYAEKHGLKIVAWYIDEGVSGRKLIKNRPQLQKMIKDAQKNEFERILFIKLDRYFRSVAEYHECQKILNEHNVTWTATEEKYDLTTANGRAFVNMKLTIAELEADQTGERIVIVNDYKVKAGLPLYGSHCLPFCYKNIQVGDHFRVMKNPEMVEATEFFFERFLMHNSVRKAAIETNEKHGIKYGYNAYKRMLANPMLYGFYKGNPKYIQEPYMDKETFDRIQSLTKRQVKISQKHDYIFSGLLRCPICGNNMAGNSRKDKGKVYKYYRCTAYRSTNLCSFSNCIFELGFEKKMLKEVESYLKDAKAKATKITESNEKISIKHNVDELHAELERLNYSWQKGRIKDVQKYDDEFDRLTALIEEATKEHEEESPVDFAKAEAALSGNWKDIYEALDDAHRRSFWKSFISSIELNKDKSIKRINFF